MQNDLAAILFIFLAISLQFTERRAVDACCGCGGCGGCGFGGRPLFLPQGGGPALTPDVTADITLTPVPVPIPAPGQPDVNIIQQGSDTDSTTARKSSSPLSVIMVAGKIPKPVLQKNVQKATIGGLNNNFQLKDKKNERLQEEEQSQNTLSGKMISFSVRRIPGGTSKINTTALVPIANAELEHSVPVPVPLMVTNKQKTPSLNTGGGSQQRHSSSLGKRQQKVVPILPVTAKIKVRRKHSKQKQQQH